METTGFSSRLLRLPLFQGFSRLDFIDIVEKERFDLRSLKAGTILVRQGEECRALVFVLGGEVLLERESYDHRFHLCERVGGMLVLQPEVLFGLHNRYLRTVVALGDVQVLQLDKETVRRLLLRYPAFQFNFYNLVCSVAQSADRQLWMSRNETLPERFGSFVNRRSYRPSGYKELKIKMTDLARELGETRLNVSKMLNEMERLGRVELHRERIVIPEFAEILKSL